jgi:hypothetical protein
LPCADISLAVGKQSVFEVLDLRIAYLASCLVFAAIQSADDFQSLRRGRLSDELDDRFVVSQWLPAPPFCEADDVKTFAGSFNQLSRHCLVRV